MNILVKKLKNGFQMPTLGLGTWLIGGDKVRDPNNDDKGQVVAIRRAIELGITLIDTAENYAQGWAERIIGQAIKGINRKKLFITSKVDKTHLHYNDLITACKSSLERLQTDYLDLYLIHSPNDEVLIEESMKAMDQLISDGLVKNIGVSNFKVSRLVEAQKHTKNKIATNQVYYNLVEREPENELLQYCQNNDVILTAFRPIEKGMLLQNVPLIMKEMAKKYRKTPVQIMLNWLISQTNVVTISKMTDLKHLDENLGALGWQMKSEDVEKLRTEYPNQIVHSNVFPLR